MSSHEGMELLDRVKDIRILNVYKVCVGGIMLKRDPMPVRIKESKSGDYGNDIGVEEQRNSQETRKRKQVYEEREKGMNKRERARRKPWNRIV